ncbi:MAG: hypothetical protein HY329_28340 [Chloroflexi bacterium]|nr:hypothetical protein [Chloroflexota bacterium]
MVTTQTTTSAAYVSQPTPKSGMRYTRAYATPDGESHFEDVDVAMPPVEVVPGEPPLYMAETIRAVGIRPLRMPADWDAGWHPAPRRWFAIALAGEIEVQTSDGELRRFGPGSMWLMEDTTGKGHHSRVVGRGDWLGIMVPLTDAPDAPHRTLEQVWAEVHAFQ